MRSNFRSPTDAIAFSVCVAILAALMAPNLVRYRSLAETRACSENLRVLGLGIHNYHAAYDWLPIATGGTTGGANAATSNAGRLSGLVGITPFMEELALWQQISSPYTSQRTGKTFPQMGPVPWFDATEYEPWGKRPGALKCPSQPDPNASPSSEDPAPKIVYTLDRLVEEPPGIGVMTNYVFCLGDGTLDIGVSVDTKSTASVMAARASQRGMFSPGFMRRGLRDVLDGTSNTIMMSEIRSSISGGDKITGIAKDVVELSRNPSLCLDASKNPKTLWHDMGRGSRWSDGALPITGFQTVLPPNSPSCSSERGILDSIASASSLHPDGVNVLMADGAIRFVTNTIDTGDSTSPGVAMGEGYKPPGAQSPFGLWGAMGTRAAKDMMNAQLPGLSPEATNAKTNNTADRMAARSLQIATFPIWVDKQRKVTLRAEFVRIIDKKTVELRDSSGVLHQVPLNSLTAECMFQAVQLDLKK